ncbi:AMP-binding protein [Corallococcus aberystwythensis]|uniref:AMP-dependent synthetase/ligase domain-containing protein n=1 Tax=Corallococcus aberystwythensis TaxID=2316722 RepID=A0A3A8Q082_9BACT|nr:AMP-binding protein [Corallococcus aberystwythensis]RKH62023.1 hypothetical protein D7W81_22925 [Corallococcus aberystwythensis]
MNSVDSGESKFGFAPSLVDLLCPQAERQGAARLYWFQEATAAAQDDARCLPAQFRAQVARTPDAEAVVGDDETLTYAELDARSDALAWHLREQGVAPDVRVGLKVERSTGMVVALLGILKAGGACVSLDPDTSPEQLAALLEDAQLRVFVTQSHRDLAPGTQGVRTVFVDSEEAFQLRVLGPPRAGTTPEGIASVRYTAGTTGQPRGEPLSHLGVSRFFNDLDARLGHAPVGTRLEVSRRACGGSVLELLWALLRGFRVQVRDAV